MADEKDVEKVETEKVETKEEAKVDEKPTEKAEEKGEKTEKVEEKVDETKEEPKEPAEPVSDEKVVEEAEPAGNGIRIEDVVTKDFLAERFAAFEAKMEAFIKENSDLKKEVSRLQEKYEDKDFGDLSKKGVAVKDRDANSSFDEYSKNFM